MTTPPVLTPVALDLDAIAKWEGRVVVFLDEPGKMAAPARRVNRLTKGAVLRLSESKAFASMKPGDSTEIAFPSGMAAEAVQVIRLPRRPSVEVARKAGAAISAARGKKPALVLSGNTIRADEITLGALLRAYAFTECKGATDEAEEDTDNTAAPITMMVNDPDELTGQLETVHALVDGVYFTRDLVNLPANILTTSSFADKLEALRTTGLKVEVLEEEDLEKLGMHMLLGVGQGSESPSKVVIMEWAGGAEDAAPLALVGKGVVFDTGGISLKPGAGMEDMTMDMGGAGVVAGTMAALAKRKAAANVVGLVGLVENMPDGKAQRPGDIVTSMKGDTVEVLNTDAEGRLVLGDVMWYAQERFKPAAMIDLATLTGAIIVALGYENAGVFSNNDALASDFLKAASAEGEGAWRMPLGPGYAKLIKGTKGDIKNIGGRWGGAITAAEFLHRFVAEDTPWIHLDIAGVTQPASPGPLAPKGASGWGVMSLNRLVRDCYEDSAD